MKKENKKTVEEEFEELFDEMTKGDRFIDTEESRRRVLFYTNKINKESQIDKSSLLIEFSI